MLLCLFLGCSLSTARLSVCIDLLFSKAEEELCFFPSADLKTFFVNECYFMHTTIILPKTWKVGNIISWKILDILL